MSMRDTQWCEKGLLLKNLFILLSLILDMTWVDIKSNFQKIIQFIN